jgi:tetratricopeptide (TPR) repeat protein
MVFESRSVNVGIAQDRAVVVAAGPAESRSVNVCIGQETPLKTDNNLARKQRLPKPEIVSDLNDPSPYVFVKYAPDGDVVRMDRETLDYQYGESSAPDPCQRDLDDILLQVNRVRVVASGAFRGQALGKETLIDSGDPLAIQTLRKSLRIVEDARTFQHCRCLGGPTLELYADLDLLATIAIHHGRGIRWVKWKHDAQLQGSEALTKWLTENGVEPAFLEVLYQNQYDGAMAPLGVQRPGSEPLSLAEQRLRLAELSRVRGGDLEDALAACNEILDDHPRLGLGYAVRGMIHSQRGNQTDTVADCSQALELGMRQVEVYFARACALDYLGRFEEALADCNSALEIDSKLAHVYAQRGFIRARLSQFHEAIGDLTESIKLAPHWPRPYYHRGLCYYCSGQLNTGLADYDRAIDLAENVQGFSSTEEGNQMLTELYCRRGEARYDLFQEDAANNDYQEARRRNPALASAYIGEMWMRRGQFAQAVDEFAESIRVRPQDARGYMNRGTAREALGEIDQAIADYTKAIEVQRDRPVAFAMRAGARHRQGRDDDALLDISQHLQLNPQDPGAYLFRATLRKKQGQWYKAHKDLLAAHRIAPKHPWVCNGLAWFLATCPKQEFRDGHRAVELARLACDATQWKQPNCLDTLAAACAETSDFDEAVQWQKQAVDLSLPDEMPNRQARLELYLDCKVYRENAVG